MAYLLALVIPAGAAALEYLFIPRPSVAPFIPLFLAVGVVAWAGGIGPGLLATALSALLGDLLFIGPVGFLALSGPGFLAVVMFLVAASLIALLAGSLRNALHQTDREASLARKYELLAANSRDIVLLVRPSDGAIREANAAALKAYGYSKEELLALTIFDLRSEQTQSEARGQIAKAQTAGLLFETIHRRKDGTTFPVEVSSQGGSIDGEQSLISVIRDISERKRADALLRESEQRVRKKLDSILSPDGDEHSLELADLIDVPALQALFDDFYRATRIPASIIDLRGAVLVGAGWQDVCTRFHRLHPETCAACIESDTKLTAGIEPGESRIYRCRNNMNDAATPIMVGGRHVGNVFTGQFFFDDEQPDQELFRTQARRFGFPEAEYLAALDRVPRLSRAAVRAGLDFLVKLAQMLSQLGSANIKLARSLHAGELLADSLREVDRRKNEFIAMLSHELRNPLAPVRNSLYVLSRAAPGSDQANRALSVIDRQTLHLTRLVDDLLEVTRIVHGKVQLRRGRLSLNELVAHVAEDHRATFASRKLELRVEIPSDPIFVDGDPTRLAQSLGNLLQNAAKFTAEGRVTLSLGEDAAHGEAEIRVVDTGVGIPAEMLSRLFQPFMQADTSLDRSKGGLGLGLSVARSLVEMHGGRLSATSDGPGEGAQFSIRLPTVGAERAQPLAQLLA